MVQNAKKPKMTLEKLATMAQGEFLAIRKDMVTKDYLDKKLEHFATKDDLRHFATKEDLRSFATKDDLRSTEVKILQAVDKVVTKFDKSEKDHAADKLLHDRHEKRLERLEAKIL